MAYTNPRGLDLNSDIGRTLTTLCQYTLADYTAAGTSVPAVGDIVTASAGGNWFVKIAGNNLTKHFGRVTKLTKSVTGTATGQVEVEWLDVLGFRWVSCDDMSTMTLLDSAIKDGDTTVLDNFDAGGTTGNLIVVAKSATSGAGTAVCALLCGS